MKLRMKILDLGQMEFEKFRLIGAENHSEIIVSPTVAVLIQHPTLGNILYDTGNDDAWKETYGNKINATLPITRYRSIVDSLSHSGLTPDDIDILIISHLYFDHVGGLKYFACTKAGKSVIVSEADKNEAFESTSLTPSGIYGEYIGKTFKNIPEVSFQGITGTVSLAKDVTLFVQKMNNAGCIGLRVDLENKGSVIVCGGTIYTVESFEKIIPPRANLSQDSNELLDNVHRIIYLKNKFKASIFFGHDREQATEWQNLGWID